MVREYTLQDFSILKFIETYFMAHKMVYPDENSCALEMNLFYGKSRFPNQNSSI